MKRSEFPTKIKIQKGDVVSVISGAESGSNKTGKVLQILPKSQKAIVEGLNMRRKHMRKTQDNPDGGVVDMEAPIHVSNLKKVDGGRSAKTASKKD